MFNALSTGCAKVKLNKMKYACTFKRKKRFNITNHWEKEIRTAISPHTSSTAI